MKNKIWILNPDYVFKNDVDRICMYSKKDLAFDSTPDWIGYIHPTQAMILGLFTQLIPAQQIIDDLSKHLNSSPDEIFNLIKDFMGNSAQIFTTWETYLIGFPKNVLIDASNLLEIPSYDFTAKELECHTVNLTPDRSHRAPHTALWMLTNTCVTNCKYCYADRQTPHQPLLTTRVLEIIDEFAALKMEHIDIIGGEIFLRKDWEIILKKLVDHHMSPTYISTKVPVTPKMAESLYNTGYKKIVQISLDSLNEKTLNLTIGTKDGYIDQIKQGIAVLESYEFPIQIDTVLTAINTTKEEITALYQYIRNIKNLTFWEIRVPELSIYHSKSFSAARASKEKLREIQTFVKDFIQPTANIKIVFSAQALDETFRQDGPEKECFNGGSCGILQNRIFILPDGKVSVCEQLYWHPNFIIGDLNISTMEEVWNSEKAKRLFALTNDDFRDTSPCKKCSHFDTCNTKKRRCVVKVIKAYGQENWDYPDPRCKYAPKLFNNLEY